MMNDPSQKIIQNHQKNSSQRDKDSLFPVQQQVNRRSSIARQNLKQIQEITSKCNLTILRNVFGNIAQPQYNPSVNYSKQFWEIYTMNENNFSNAQILSIKVKDLEKVLNQYKEISLQLQQKAKKIYQKRSRRTAQQIIRRYQCPFQSCYRVYGSDVSLNLHMKIKHNAGNKLERQRIARQICSAQIENKKCPNYDINFPPGYLQKIKCQLIAQKPKDEGIQQQKQQLQIKYKNKEMQQIRYECLQKDQS